MLTYTFHLLLMLWMVHGNPTTLEESLRDQLLIAPQPSRDSPSTNSPSSGALPFAGMFSGLSSLRRDLVDSNSQNKKNAEAIANVEKTIDLVGTIANLGNFQSQLKATAQVKIQEIEDIVLGARERHSELSRSVLSVEEFATLIRSSGITDGSSSNSEVFEEIITEITQEILEIRTNADLQISLLEENFQEAKRISFRIANSDSLSEIQSDVASLTQIIGLARSSANLLSESFLLVEQQKTSLQTILRETRADSLRDQARNLLARLRISSYEAQSYVSTIEMIYFDAKRLSEIAERFLIGQDIYNEILDKTSEIKVELRLSENQLDEFLTDLDRYRTSLDELTTADELNELYISIRTRVTPVNELVSRLLIRRDNVARIKKQLSELVYADGNLSPYRCQNVRIEYEYALRNIAYLKYLFIELDREIVTTKSDADTIISLMQEFNRKKGFFSEDYIEELESDVIRYYLEVDESVGKALRLIERLEELEVEANNEESYREALIIITADLIQLDEYESQIKESKSKLIFIRKDLYDHFREGFRDSRIDINYFREEYFLQVKLLRSLIEHFFDLRRNIFETAINVRIFVSSTRISCTERRRILNRYTLILRKLLILRRINEEVNYILNSLDTLADLTEEDDDVFFVSQALLTTKISIERLRTYVEDGQRLRTYVDDIRRDIVDWIFAELRTSGSLSREECDSLEIESIEIESREKSGSVSSGSRENRSSGSRESNRSPENRSSGSREDSGSQESRRSRESGGSPKTSGSQQNSGSTKLSLTQVKGKTSSPKNVKNLKEILSEKISESFDVEKSNEVIDIPQKSLPRKKRFAEIHEPSFLNLYQTDDSSGALKHVESWLLQNSEYKGSHLRSGIHRNGLEETPMCQKPLPLGIKNQLQQEYMQSLSLRREILNAVEQMRNIMDTSESVLDVVNSLSRSSLGFDQNKLRDISTKIVENLRIAESIADETEDASRQADTIERRAADNKSIEEASLFFSRINNKLDQDVNTVYTLKKESQEYLEEIIKRQVAVKLRNTNMCARS